MPNSTNLANDPIEYIREELIDLQKAGASIDRVETLFARSSLLVQRNDLHLDKGPLSVEFRGVTFGYNDEAGNETILDDVSFDIAPGRVVGLLGRTGSGRSVRCWTRPDRRPIRSPRAPRMPPR